VDPGGGGNSVLQEGIDVARRALQNENCSKLFGDLSKLGFKSPTDLLDTYANNGLIRFGSKDANGKNFESASVGANTTYATGSYSNANGIRISANVITVNKNGFFFTGLLDGGRFVNTIAGGGFEGLTMSQIRGAVIIHELLHAVNKIPTNNPKNLNDGGKQSKANAELVRRNCFGDK